MSGGDCRCNTRARISAFLAAAALAIVGAACSTLVSEPADPWTATYVESADRVWTAIHATLEALGYDVEDEDRRQGAIEAAQAAAPSYRSIVLHIEVVSRAEQVRVDVRPSGGATGTPDDSRRRDETVREFLTALDERLGRRLPSR